MNYPHQNVVQTKKVIQTKDMKISLYDQSKNPPMFNRIFAKKTPHSLDKILKQNNKLNVSASIIKQINEKKLAPNYSFGNIINTTEGNQNNSFAYSVKSNQNIKNNYSINSKLTYDDIDQNTAQIKERLIQSLKNNFNQEKIRKKILSGNINDDYGVSNDNCSHSFYENERKGYKPLIFTKINQNLPLKFQTNSKYKMKNSFHTNISILNSNNGNISFNTELNKNNFSTAENKSINRQSSVSNNDPNELNPKLFGTKVFGTNISQFNSKSIFDLELKMEKILKENKTNSKSKKYNAIKYIFEEFVKLTTGEVQTLLKKLLFSYHEVVSAFSNENRSLKELNESAQNKCLALDKILIETNKGIKKKEIEYESIKKKMLDLEKAFHENNVNNMISKEGSDASTQPQMSSKEHIKAGDNIRLQHVQSLNVKNVEDLDALYFYDKIQMNVEESDYSKMPKLDLTCFGNTANKDIDQSKVNKKYIPVNKH